MWRYPVIRCQHALKQYSSTLKDVQSPGRHPGWNLLVREKYPGLYSHRNFHVTKSRNVPPIFVALIKPVSRVAVALLGRGLRKWWQSLPKNKKSLLIQHLMHNQKKYILGSALFAGGIYYYIDGHIVNVSITQRNRFMYFTQEQLHIISKQQYENDVNTTFAGKLLPVTHPEYEKVCRVGNRILQANNHIPELYKLKWTMTIVDDFEENAYVLPSGDIIVYRGMLDLLETDDELAIILGHEMSHTILGHQAEKLSHGYLIDLLALFPLAVIWAFLPNDGIAAVTHWFMNKVVNIFVTLPYSRKLEKEADSVGLMLAAKACYDVRESSALWGRLELIEKFRNENEGEGPLPSWLSTHPAHSERQNDLDLEIPEAIIYRENCKCPKLGNLDPRTIIRQIQKKLETSSKEQDSPFVTNGSIQPSNIPITQMHMKNGNENVTQIDVTDNKNVTLV